MTTQMLAVAAEIKHKSADPYPEDVKMAFYDALFKYFNTSEVRAVDPDKNISDIIQRIRHCLGRKGYTITLAEPAAPSADEVEVSLQVIRDAGQFGAESKLRAHIAAQAAEIERLHEAVKGALGYLRNARIDLETGAPKRTAVNTLGGGIAMVESALAGGKAGAS